MPHRLLPISWGEIEKPAAAQLLKPRVLFWLNFSLEVLRLKMVTCLLETVGYGTQGREWAKGLDNMALPDTTKFYFLEGSFLWIFSYTYLCLHCALLGSDTLHAGLPVRICHSQYQVRSLGRRGFYCSSREHGRANKQRRRPQAHALTKGLRVAGLGELLIS